jgi:ketosteroid isomerase-like protein
VAALTEGDRDAALARERELWEAFRARDRARIEALVDPLALDVGPAGALSRDGVVDAVAHMRIDSFAIDVLAVRSRDDVDVVTTRSTVEGTYRGAPFPDASVLATSVWARARDGWRLLHRHESPAR